MPRNVRNFWIEAEVDGRKTPVKFGPRGEDGGFSLTIYIRNRGEIERVAEITGTLVEGILGTPVEEDSLVLWIECEADCEDIALERIR